MEATNTTLTIYFDGQFYIGLFERIENNKISVCKYIFGAEPKDYEVYELVLNKYYSLRFSPTVEIERKPIDLRNPKTRQRKIKKTIANIEIGTKSQQAIKKQIEERKIERKVISFVIAGAVIFGIGIAIMVITLGVNGWNIDDDYEMMSYECSEQNSVLDLEFSAGMLDIDYYDGDTIKVEYPQNKNLTANITEKDGTLTYETISPRKWWNWNWLRNIPTAKILIPKGDVIDVQLDIDAGTVKIADGAYGNFEVEMNAGTLDVGNIVCDKLLVEMNAGTIGVKSASSSKDVLMDVSAGTIKIGSLTCPSFVGDVNAGTANIERLQASSTVVDISAGTMKLCMVGAKSEYNVVVDKSAGSCNISSQKGSKNLQILAEISAGTLVVKFTS